MEFREILALAKKKQSRHDDEVKRIEEQRKQRDLERKRQLEVAEKLNRKFAKPLPSGKNVSIGSCNTKKTSVGAASESKNVTIKPEVSRPVPSVSKADSKTHCDSRNYGEAIDKPTSKDSKKNTEVQRKPSRLSFTEMMELAKKNVQSSVVGKRPFDDLIPCPVDSKYRRLDSKSVNIQPPDKTTISSTKCKPPPLHSQLDSQKVSPSLTSKKSSKPFCLNSFGKADKDSVMEKAVKRFEKNGRVSPSLPVKSDRKMSNVAPVNQSSTLQKTNLKHLESSKVSQANISRETKLQTKIPTTVKLTDTLKLKANPYNTEKALVSRTAKTPITLTNGKCQVPLPKPASASTEKSNKNHFRSKDIQIQKPKGNPQPKRCDDAPQRRGIAAQLGVSFQSQNSAALSVSGSEEEDEYLSDDSFIDDSEALQSKEYARVVRDIHRALKFDPRKYKDVNPYEDLRCMEAKYCDIEKEERRSARLAALEDNEELIRDMMRRKAKLVKKRQQIVDDDEDDR
ncbi:unnamed protein product [Heterobilharzia americana]|nr:unnamed protein product [Heterobilharzia americana]